MRRTVLWLGAALVVGYLLVPQLGGARRSLRLLDEVNPALVVMGIVLQAGGILAQAQLTRSMLPRGKRVSAADMTRIELATMAASHTVPGGTAAGTALAFKLLRSAGVPAGAAGFAVGARGLGSAVVLNVVLWLALVISIPVRGFHGLYVTAAALAIVLLSVVGGLVLLLARHHRGAARFVRRVVARVPLLDEHAVARGLEEVARRVREMGERPAGLAAASGWSAIYWLASASSLWVFVAAFGHRVDPVSLVVAFGVANVLAFIPITPQGLGVVEATLIPLLVWFGAGQGEATLGVLTWRLFAFWLPIPVGGLAYLSLTVARPSADGEQSEGGRRGRWRDVADELFGDHTRRRPAARTRHRGGAE